MNWVAIYLPVPVNPTELGELEALLVILSVPLNVVREVGANLMLTEQFLPGRIAAPQLWLAMVKVVEPLMVSELMLRSPVPVFVILMDFVELPPTPVLKLSDAGDKLMVAATPVPDKVTVCGLVGASSTN